jgi:hypothetical protein
MIVIKTIDEANVMKRILIDTFVADSMIQAYSILHETKEKYW